MNFNNFTIKAQEAVQEAVNLVQSRGQQAIEPVHVLQSVMKVGENVTNFIFQKLGMNGQQIALVLDKQIESLPKVSGGEPYLSRETNEVFQKATQYSKEMGDEFVSLEPVLLALLNVKSTASTILKDAGMTERELREAINELRKGEKVTSQSSEDTYQSLEKYAINLNEAARSGKLDPVIGREKEIQKELKKLKNLKQTNIPKALAYVSGELFEQYIHDMKIVQHFAMLNRQAMMDEIVKGMKLHVEEQFTTIHNYIDTDAMILRKGAVSAKEGERLLIPINMRDGSLLCVGKGNEDWNCSAPHGAGRLMSRADAKQSFTVSEFKKQMAEVYTTSVSKATLDECPMAYKGMQDILDNIGPTADVVKIIRPIYNFKAGDED